MYEFVLIQWSALDADRGSNSMLIYTYVVDPLRTFIADAGTTRR